MLCEQFMQYEDWAQKKPKVIKYMVKNYFSHEIINARSWSDKHTHTHQTLSAVDWTFDVYKIIYNKKQKRK